MKEIHLDPTVAYLLIALASFLFSSLLGILIFLAKRQDSRLARMESNQETAFLDNAKLQKDMNTLKEEIQEVKKGLGEMPGIKEALVRHNTDIENLKVLIADYRQIALEGAKSIRELEKLYYSKNNSNS